MKERYDKSVNNQQLQRKREELTREIRNHDYDHNIMQNLKTALTSSLGRFRGSDDGVKNIFLIVFKNWESFSYG